MIEVKIVKDNDGHTYVIPAELHDKFISSLGYAEMTQNYNIFISAYSKYMKNPDDLKLYTDEI